MEVVVEKVRTQLYFLEPVILGTGIAGRNNEFDGRKQGLELERNLLVAGIGHRNLGGGIHVGVGHIGKVLHHLAHDIFIDTGILLLARNGAGNRNGVLQRIGV